MFVADSQESRFEANLESMKNLEDALREHGLNIDTIPYVLQLNKRDLPTSMATDALRNALLRNGEPVFEAVATEGVGVFDTLKAVAKLILARLKGG